MRHLRPQLAGGDYVIVARPAAARAGHAELAASLRRLLRKLGALPAPPPGGTMPAPPTSVSPSDPKPDPRTG